LRLNHAGQRGVIVKPACAGFFLSDDYLRGGKAKKASGWKMKLFDVESLCELL